MAVHPHRVVIVGSGFGGLFATRALRGAGVAITLVDRTNHHLFQPLLYQVATGILSEGEIAPAIRDVLARRSDVAVLQAEVTDIDLASRTVEVRHGPVVEQLGYDSLIVAAGVHTSYFGHDDFAPLAPGLKTVADALELRERIFGAFETAEAESDPQRRVRCLTFVVVGGGPTGVEMAGQIAELAHRALPGRFRRVDTSTARVVLCEGSDHVLGDFGPRLAARACRDLEALGVEVRLRTMVVDVDADGVTLAGPDGATERVAAGVVVWAAGMAASPLGRSLAEQSGAELDRMGRVRVRPDCSLPGHPEVFVVGDLMSLDGLPGMAEVALQSGRHAGKIIRRRVAGDPGYTAPLRYIDLGSMATVSRFRAVARRGRLRVAGFTGWVLWLAVHLVFLTGFKNRFTALLHWAVSFGGRGRSERTIVGVAPSAPAVAAGPAPGRPAPDGPAPDGPVTNGPATNGPAPDRSVTDGPAADGTAARRSGRVPDPGAPAVSPPPGAAGP
jgi:NADH dehydrogenase